MIGNYNCSLKMILLLAICISLVSSINQHCDPPVAPSAIDLTPFNAFTLNSPCPGNSSCLANGYCACD
jgi:hypothetical protein